MNLSVKYSKTYGDGTTIFVEDIRVGRKELATVSMWKKKNPTRTDANHTEATQISDLSGISVSNENIIVHRLYGGVNILATFIE